MRYLIASAVMLPIWIYRGRPLPARSDWPTVASLGLFGFCLYNLGINYGERTVNAGKGSMLISCIPVLVILLGVCTGREKVGLLAWLGIGLSMTGVVLTAAGSETGLTFNLGSLLILGAAFCAAVQTLISKALTRRYAAVDVTTWAIWVGTLGLLPFSEDLVGTAARLSGLSWLHLIFLGMVPAALCYTIWSWVLVTLPITNVMSAVYAIPVFSVLFGWLILGEQPSVLTFVGGAVTLAGVAWVQSLTRKQRS
jgi:drug/metabolite transporter (DMT)-like permease